jgi:hypothetical protein
MVNSTFLLAVFNPPLFVSELGARFEKETLVQVILILALLLVAVVSFDVWRILKNKGKGTIWRPLFRLKLDVFLDKDRVFHPQVLTMTIKNTGKREVEIDAPVLEFRKIWSKRKFKLNGIKGNYIYPMMVNPGDKHQLFIETARFHQYDNEIKSFYWARIYVTDVEGRRWKSNDVKLRKSLVT